MKPLKLLVFALIAALPSPLKRLILSHLFGFEIHPSSSIGVTLFWDVEHLVMNAGARIGQFNVIKGVSRLCVGEHGSIGNLNWITAFSNSDSSHYQGETDRDPSLIVGQHASITHRHLIDCTGGVTVGEYSTVAGFRSQVLTHSIDLYHSQQRSKAVIVGRYCFVGTASILLPGAVVPDFSVVAAGSVVTGALDRSRALYAGVPAKFAKDLSEAVAYFDRPKGAVD